MRALGSALLLPALLGCSDLLGADFDPSATQPAIEAGVDAGGAASDASDAGDAEIVPPGKVLWATGLKGNIQQAAAAGLLVDADGDIYVAGIVTPPADFGCPQGPVAGHSENGHAFLTKYSPSGACLWTRLFDTGFGNRIALGPDGNPWLAGYFSPELYVDEELGTLFSAGWNDNFAIQLDAATGKPLAAFRVGSDVLIDEARTLLVHSSGDLLIAGGVKSPGEFLDAFIGRYTPGGQEVWYRKWGGSSEDLVPTMAWAGPNKVVVAGTIFGNVTGDVELEAQGKAMFAAAFDIGGGLLWAGKVDGASNDSAQTMAIESDRAFLVGATANPKNDILLGSKATGNGLGGVTTYYGLADSNEVAYGIAVTPGARYLAGYFDNETLMSDEPLVSAGLRDVLVARVTNEGVTWTRRFGGTGQDVANAVAMTPDGNIVLLGTFTGENLHLDEFELPAGAAESFFLAKLAP